MRRLSLPGVLCAVAAALWIGPAANAQAEARVTAVRFWNLGEMTRISIEVSTEFRFKSDRLPDPDRVFFDIGGARPGFGHKGFSTIPVGSSVVRQIRVAETQPGTTRVVLDLQGSPEFTASRLSNPERLMIELRHRDATAPLLTRGTTSVRRFEAPPQRLRPEAALLDVPPVLAVSVPAVPMAFARGGSLSPGPPSAGFPMVAKSAVAAVPGVARPDGSVARAAAEAMAPGMPRSSRPAASGAPLPAKRPPATQSSLTRVLGLKLGKVVIDPGHGGHDVGTAGPTGLYEKDLVLDVSRRLGALIESRLGGEVVYTRNGDSFIPLEERTAIANQNRADLFLSIHANSSPVPSASGVETYYLNFTSSRTALEVAARENAGSGRSIYDLRDLVQQIALKDKLEESREFASKVQASLISLARNTNGRSKDRGVRKAPFVVLIGAAMPSVLVEIGFLSNPKDETLMKRSDYRQRIAEALYKGVAQYANSLSHFQVAKRDSE